jgi:sugar lactone lactonase YvrE
VNATPANPQIREYPTPNSNSTPNYITSGPDGALWFTETTVNKIGRIPVTATPGSSAQITEFAIPTANSFPQGIVSGPDGALWFAESNSSKIGRITATGLVTELATPTGGSSPNSITVGPDNNIWVTEAAVSVNRIARLQVDKPSQSLIIVGHGDLDLDGTQDVVLRDPISRGITVWYMSAGQIAQSVVLAPSMPNSWTFLGVGDFAGDGRARLLWRNSESGEVGFWTVSGRGASISWSSIAIGVFTGWSFQGIADVNGDRRSDIIWRYVDGVIGAWTMNGATITSWQPFPNLP